MDRFQYREKIIKSPDDGKYFKNQWPAKTILFGKDANKIAAIQNSKTSDTEIIRDR